MPSQLNLMTTLRGRYSPFLHMRASSGHGIWACWETNLSRTGVGLDGHDSWDPYPGASCLSARPRSPWEAPRGLLSTHPFRKWQLAF